MFSELHNVFREAYKDESATKINGEDYKAVLLLGIKIILYQDDTLTIFNTSKGGDYYQEISEDEYTLFIEKGWRYALYTMAIDRYTAKTENIREKIREEINTRNNTRYLDFLKSNLELTMNKYYKITQKLNQL
tara:strand:+ start:217 stop:615 length:399 start_codon:yes stop_codon:yes gene_type:complete